jgi:hypothetical protein
LQLSTSRVVQLDREGRLRALRDSAGRRFYRPEDVERFVAEREREAAARSARAHAAKVSEEASGV